MLLREPSYHQPRALDNHVCLCLVLTFTDRVGQHRVRRRHTRANDQRFQKRQAGDQAPHEQTADEPRDGHHRPEQGDQAPLLLVQVRLRK